MEKVYIYLVALAGDGVLADLVSFHHHLDTAELVVLEDVAVHLRSEGAGFSVSIQTRTAKEKVVVRT